MYSTMYTGEQFDKAAWASSFNTSKCCNICIEEIRAGNWVNGLMTSRGYKNIAEKYYLSTGLRHSRLQLKNRWDQLKGLYAFWLWLLKQTGLGRSNGTVVAGEQFWKTHTKNKSEWKKLKHGPPEWLKQLEVMCEHTLVDGSTSCIPGESTSTGGDEDESEGYEPSPRPDCSDMRAGSSNIGATSPLNTGKSPMIKIMKGIWGTMESNNVATKKFLEGEIRRESINKAMRLTVQSGAKEALSIIWLQNFLSMLRIEISFFYHGNKCRKA